MKTDCIAFLSLIPIVGGIAALVLYFILAFSSKTAASLKTRYQANLIWAAISIGLSIIAIIILIALGVSLSGIGSTRYY